MGADWEIGVGAAIDIQSLRPIFAALHEHHRSVSAVALTEPAERAWQARSDTYSRHFTAGQALLHIGARDGTPLGYAFTVLHPGSDDTFPLGDGYGELYTLAVLPEARGGGLGTALLDAVDAALAHRGIPNLMVVAMTGNDAAIRLYRRRGLVPVEIVMYRLGPPTL